MNEVQVDLDEDGRVRLRRAGGDEGVYTLETTEALRAFFQAERDETLGRWRDPEHPDWVVYPLADGTVMVSNEQSQYRGFWSRKGTRECALKWGSADVARRYFQAHPEPKPWDAAQPDEVWVLTDGDRSEVFRCGEHGLYQLKTGNPLSRVFPILTVTSGRRIWPEGGES